MRILSVATTHPRFVNDSEPAYVLALNRELVRLGHRVTTILPHAEGAARSEVVDGVEIRRFRYFLPASAQRLCYNGGILPNLRKSWIARVNLPFFVVSQGLSVAAAVAGQTFDVVHCHWLITSGLMGAFVAPLARIPLVVTAHGSDVFTENPVFRFLDRFVLSRASVCTANSRRSGELVSKLNPNTRIQPVPMGVHPGQYGKHLASDAIRAEMGGGTPQILFVGRFTENKGVTDLVRAMKLISERLDRARLALVGFGPAEDSIRRTIENEGLDDRVTIMGRVSRDEIPAHMASADLLVLPSLKVEGLGVVLLEALASGTPVVGTRVGGIPDIISDGVTGLLCHPGDPQNIATTCLRMLEDSDLRRTTIENGKGLIEDRFSWTRIGAFLESVLLGCVEGRDLSDGVDNRSAESR